MKKHQATRPIASHSTQPPSPVTEKKRAAALRVVSGPTPIQVSEPGPREESHKLPHLSATPSQRAHGREEEGRKPVSNRMRIETHRAPPIQFLLAQKALGKVGRFDLPLDSTTRTFETRSETGMFSTSKGVVALPYGSRTAARRKALRKAGTGVVPQPRANRLVSAEKIVEVERGGGDLVFHNPGDAGPSTTVSYLGGATVPNLPLQLIFWGSIWTQPTSAPSAGSVVGAAQSILAGPYMTALGQYGIGRAQLRGAIIVTSPQPPNPFSDDDVKNLVWDLIDQGTFPEPDDNDGRNLYMVIMPSGVNPTGTSNIGEHTYATDYDFPFDFDKAWCGWVTNDGTLDTVTTILSHELVEACTDPEGDGWQVNPTNSDSWNEIGDACQSSARLNGVMVQSYWSQRDQACIIPTGTLPAGGVAGVPELIQSRFGSKGCVFHATVTADFSVVTGHFKNIVTGDFRMIVTGFG